MILIAHRNSFQFRCVKFVRCEKAQMFFLIGDRQTSTSSIEPKVRTVVVSHNPFKYLIIMYPHENLR